MKCKYCKKVMTHNLTFKEVLLPIIIKETSLCHSCHSKFEKLRNENCCSGCHRQKSQSPCKDCQQWQVKYPNYLFRHEALYAYNRAMQEWFEEYKFKGNYSLRYSFASSIKRYFKKKKEFLLVPIPLSKEREKERKFNQVSALLDGANVKYNTYLERNQHQLPQVKKTRAERIALPQCFELKKEAIQQIKNKKILIIDDVYTTGRTLFNAAEVILSYQPFSVSTFSLAR